MDNRKIKKGYAIDMFALTIAALIRAVSLIIFANPNKISAGGVTGLTTILVNYFPSLADSSAMLMVVFNAPLLILAFIFLNKKFALYTIIQTVLMSLFIFILEIPSLNLPLFNDDQFLAAICTGMLNGIGLGVLLRVNCSTGGTDIVGLLVQNKLPQVKVLWLILLLDTFFAALAGIVFKDLSLGIYSFIALFVNSFAAEKIQRGFVSTVEFKIITEKVDEVAGVITQEFHRSATLFNAVGAFTKQPRKFIIAVVSRREAIQLKKRILDVDESAFFYVTNIYEIVGNGFLNNVQPKSKIK